MAGGPRDEESETRPVCDEEGEARSARGPSGDGTFVHQGWLEGRRERDRTAERRFTPGLRDIGRGGTPGEAGHRARRLSQERKDKRGKTRPLVILDWLGVLFLGGVKQVLCVESPLRDGSVPRLGRRDSSACWRCLRGSTKVRMRVTAPVREAAATAIHTLRTARAPPRPRRGHANRHLPSAREKGLLIRILQTCMTVSGGAGAGFPRPARRDHLDLEPASSERPLKESFIVRLAYPPAAVEVGIHSEIAQSPAFAQQSRLSRRVRKAKSL
ncbi:hypothetical protein B0H16DRAFT_1454637 [Mycena metata]|uniref:Uncharacterized protein n=1 Tax=Mycena metata TaxID=1033252 RepID=A0AAD7JJS9_9AGAR|nr:hypothetical protein B0H16DRAFT_1454637 [Mycena metata]